MAVQAPPPQESAPPRYQRWSTTAAGGTPEDKQVRRRDEVFDAAQTPPRSPSLMFGLILGVAAAAFWFSMQTDYLLGMMALPVLAVATLHGLCRGGFHKLLMLPVTLGIAYTATVNPHLPSEWFTKVTGKTNELGGAIVGIVAAVLIFSFASYLAKAIRRRVILPQKFLLGMDRVFGSTVGFAEGSFFVLCLCWTTVLLQPQAITVRDHSTTNKESFKYHLANTIVRLTEDIDNSPLQPVARDANLLMELESVKAAIEKLKKTEGLKVDSLDYSNLIKESGDSLRRSPGNNVRAVRRPVSPPSK